MIYFNPRTHRGVRLIKLLALSLKKRISIHAPIVGCDDHPVSGGVAPSVISIHAPIVGCDPSEYLTTVLVQRFQSTHPSWGATFFNIVFCFLIRFQSTHPSWGATMIIINNINFSVISIHAPIVGCDGRQRFLGGSAY